MNDYKKHKGVIYPSRFHTRQYEVTELSEDDVIKMLDGAIDGCETSEDLQKFYERTRAEIKKHSQAVDEPFCEPPNWS